MMDIAGAICSFCGCCQEELQLGSLFSLSDSEVSRLTFNIILVLEPFLICSKCCQELALVGKLLYNWRAKIKVSLESGIDVAPKQEEVEELGETLDEGEFTNGGENKDGMLLNHKDDVDGDDGELIGIEEQKSEEFTHGQRVGQKLCIKEEKTFEEGKRERRLRSCGPKSVGRMRLIKKRYSQSSVELMEKQVVDDNVPHANTEDEVEDELRNVEIRVSPELSDMEHSKESDSSDWEVERRKQYK